jgi:hypothetical protein
MNPPHCPCDGVAAPELSIHAGLSILPRQLATFPEFRTLMLQAVGQDPVLSDWRARSNGDFGIMLLDMWAYVCDCISFYDEAIANEAYLRTAQLRPSLRKLVALLGYLPRPAVGAMVDLAILAEGRRPILLPPGTAFRSGAFPGGTPQVFELDMPGRVHPFTNRWTLARSRRSTLDVPRPPVRSQGLVQSRPSGPHSFLVDPKSLRVKAGEIVLIQDLDDSSNTRARTVSAIEDTTEVDGVTYKKLTLSGPVPVPPDTPLASLRISAPTQTARVHSIYYAGLFFLDTLYLGLQVGDPVILEKHGELRWFTVTFVFETSVDLPSNTSPPPKALVTAIIADGSYFQSPWNPTEFASIQVHIGLRPVATPTAPADLSLKPGEPMNLVRPYEAPQDGWAPGRLLLEDKDSNGEKITAAIDFARGMLGPMVPISSPMMAPVTVYGNVVTGSRGESVSGEVLGSGDASGTSQTFMLKKSPLTYFPAPDGVVSSLKVYVDGLQWNEVRSFFGMTTDAQVYVVRQNDAGESLVTFGDGVRGRRLTSGINNVVAFYRFGAGKLSPPAESIRQMSKPVKGVTSVRNPVAAFGGDDAEDIGGLRTYAPRSALLLGRAISIRDMEAAAASVGGVRAVSAAWIWNKRQQRPVVQIWYIGPLSAREDLIARLAALTDSVTPVDAERAAPITGTLALSVAIEEGRIDADVTGNVRGALLNPQDGILAPEHIGIGLPLFRSRIFQRVLSIPGTAAVNGLLWNGKSFGQVRGIRLDYAIQPGAGRYFDFENGTLLINGKGVSHG